MSKAQSALASDNEQVRRLALYRLHLRWYHCCTKNMEELLRAAGTPTRAITEVRSVVQGCTVCRDWVRPGPRSVTAYRMCEAFNEEVQFDILYYHSTNDPLDAQILIMHLVDWCIRWSATGVVKSREENDLCTGISRVWIAIHGAMGTLVTDQETGLHGQTASDWAEANDIALKYKAPHQHAQIVERHNEVLRDALHKTEHQLAREGHKVQHTAYIQRSPLNREILVSARRRKTCRGAWLCWRAGTHRQLHPHVYQPKGRLPCRP